MTYIVQFGRPSRDITTTFEITAQSKAEARKKAAQLAAQYHIEERLTDVRQRQREVV